MATKLYVGNLSYQTTEDTVRSIFSEYGEVESANVIMDRYTGRSKGFAFVEMATEETALAAIDGLNGKSVDGREIRVEKAKPRPDRDSQRPGWGRSRW